MLSAEAIVSIDSTGHDVLHDLTGDLHDRGVRFTVARAKQGLVDTLERSGLSEEVDALHLEVDVGMYAFLRDEETAETDDQTADRGSA